MYKLVIANDKAIIQERRNFYLTSDEEEFVLDDLLSWNVSVVPCKPQINQIIYQQDIENNSSTILLSDGQHIFSFKGEPFRSVTQENEETTHNSPNIRLLQSDNQGIIVYPGNKCISASETSQRLCSRKVRLITSHPEFDHEFDLFYNLPLQWSVSYTLFIDENQDQFHFAGKYHINNDTTHTFLNAEVSFLLGSNQSAKPKTGYLKTKRNNNRKVKGRRSASPSKKKCNGEKVIAFHVEECVDILPGMNSIPFAQGFIEPINKHYLVAFENQLPDQPQVVIDTDQGGGSEVMGYEVIEIQNSSAEGLGIRFPPGDIQILWTNNPDSFEVESFYRSKLALTEESEVIRFNLQPVETLTGSRERIKFIKDEKKFTLTEEITLSVSNRSYHSVTTIVEDTLFRWKNWKITQTSTEFHPNGKDRARWILKLLPNATETIQYTVQYSWE